MKGKNGKEARQKAALERRRADLAQYIAMSPERFKRQIESIKHEIAVLSGQKPKSKSVEVRPDFVAEAQQQLRGEQYIKDVLAWGRD